MIEVEIIKGIPKDKINKFEDRVVYNTAAITREYVKSSHGYPYLSGKLERTETASAITGGNKEYNLLAGVDYAKYVWDMTNVNWTNSETIPKWYYNAFRQKGNIFLVNAIIRAMEEIK